MLARVTMFESDPSKADDRALIFTDHTRTDYPTTPPAASRLMGGASSAMSTHTIPPRSNPQSRQHLKPAGNPPLSVARR